MIPENDGYERMRQDHESPVAGKPSVIQDQMNGIAVTRWRRVGASAACHSVDRIYLSLELQAWTMSRDACTLISLGETVRVLHQNSKRR